MSMKQPLTKEQVLILLNEAKEHAIKSSDPHSYMYPVLLSIIQDTYGFKMDEIKDLYGLPLMMLDFLEKPNK